MDKQNEELISFISKRSGLDENQIYYHSIIEDDLGVTGDDSEGLIIEFSKIFKVDIKKFSFNKYFYPEPMLFYTDDSPKIPLNVGHLAKAITSGRLDDLDIQTNTIHN